MTKTTVTLYRQEYLDDDTYSTPVAVDGWRLGNLRELISAAREHGVRYLGDPRELGSDSIYTEDSGEMTIYSLQIDATPSSQQRIIKLFS